MFKEIKGKNGEDYILLENERYIERKKKEIFKQIKEMDEIEIFLIICLIISAVVTPLTEVKYSFGVFILSITLVPLLLAGALVIAVLCLGAVSVCFLPIFKLLGIFFKPARWVADLIGEIWNDDSNY